jgi:hypothetical protein
MFIFAAAFVFRDGVKSKTLLRSLPWKVVAYNK